MSFYGNLRASTITFITAGISVTDDVSGRLAINGNIDMTNYNVIAGNVQINRLIVQTIPTLTSNRNVYINSSGYITGTASPTNGELLIGKTGDAPQLASLTAGTGITITPGAGSITIAATGNVSGVQTITGTANQVIASSSTGDVTLSMPSNVTINALTVSGLTPKAEVYTGTGGLIKTTTPTTAGNILIGSTGNAPVYGTITGGNGITITGSALNTINTGNAGVTSITQGTVYGVGVGGTATQPYLTLTTYFASGGISMSISGVGERWVISNTDAGVSVPATATNTLVWEYDFAGVNGNGVYYCDWYLVWRRNNGTNGNLSTTSTYRYRHSFYISGTVITSDNMDAINPTWQNNNFGSMTNFPNILYNTPSNGYIQWKTSDSTYPVLIKIVAEFSYLFG